MLEAEKIPHRLDVLADPTKEDQDVIIRCFLCPEPLRISQLPTRVVGMALLFPAIIHRIESYLIALEVCERIKIHVTPSLALEAITKDSDNTEDARAERINFQRGMGPNYERLEFIGDSFLKTATTISLFALYSRKEEGVMHADRKNMICNKTLLDKALEGEQYRYIRATSFSR